MGSTSDPEPAVHARIRQQEVVAELGQQALESDDLDRVFRDAAAGIADALDHEYAMVLQARPGDEAVLRQGVGWRDGVVGSATVSTDRTTQAGYALHASEPVVVEDLASEERISGSDLLTDHDVRAGISVRIETADGPWGVLGAHTTERASYPDHDAAFVARVAEVLGAAIEETQTKRTLRERERELQQTFDRITDAFIGLDQDWTITYINDRGEELLDPDDQGLVGENFWDPFEPALGTTFEAEYRKTMETQEPTSFEEYYPPLGIWFEVHAYPSESGLSIYFRDATERRERERQLERSERRYRTLAEYFPNGIVTLFDRELRYTLAAGQALEEMPVDAEDIEGAIPTDVWGEDVGGEIEPLLRKTLDGEEAEPVEVSYAGRTWLIRAVPVTDESGDVFAGMTMAQDVTERKRYERRLEESNERLEQFAYATSHDLQEPLRMVSSYLQLIERRYGDELGEDGAEFLEFAVDGADRMRSMIDGLLEYARVETQGEPLEPIDLDAVLADALANLQVKIEESEAEITAESLPCVQGDESQLQQLFQNLLSNAIEYSGTDSPRIRLTADDTGRMRQISVHDEGIGIDPDDRERIFDIFQRLHGREEHAGAGIGLALCQRIVERHGGEIWVESDPGEGSTFSVTLPPAAE